MTAYVGINEAVLLVVDDTIDFRRRNDVHPTEQHANPSDTACARSGSDAPYHMRGIPKLARGFERRGSLLHIVGA